MERSCKFYVERNSWHDNDVYARSAMWRWRGGFEPWFLQELVRRRITETASPTPAKETPLICLFACSRKIPLWSGDVSQAFLHAPIKDDIYIKNPAIGVDEELASKGKYWKLKKSVYGLNDAPAMWHDEFGRILRKCGWLPVAAEPCMWVKHEKCVEGINFVSEQVVNNEVEAVLAVHVDDVLIAAKDPARLLKEIPVKWKESHAVSKFLGVEFEEAHVDNDGKKTEGYWMGQPEYAAELPKLEEKNPDTWDISIFAGALPGCARYKIKEKKAPKKKSSKAEQG